MLHHGLSTSSPRKSLAIPEIVEITLSYVEDTGDLLKCAWVNSTWSLPALKQLYKGSINDMRYRTPNIQSLSCLLVASPQDFTRYMSFVEHLLIAPDRPLPDETGDEVHSTACLDKCRPLRY